MNGLLKFRLRLGQVCSNPANLFLLILLTLSTIQSGLAQTPPLLPCQEEIPTFTGVPEQTLCEQYPNFSCETQIGVGTAFPKSSLLGTSSLSGNVCIVGDFEVDVPLTFLGAIVKINPGVTIAIAPSPNGYDVGSSLGINNSKLFACNGLWKGITLGQLSSISSWNNSVIEDAETAIYASGFCNLAIQQTTFNRDRVGIELFTPFPNIWVPGPVMWGFFGNQFICNAPLNGTTNEITQIGIKLRNSDLFPFYGNTDNTFRGIIKGIVVESTGATYLDQCNVFVNNYYFINIRGIGIDFNGRSLNVQNSTFENNAQYGINFVRSSFLNLSGNEFYIRELTSPPIIRYMVYIQDPKADNNLNISDNYFYSEGDLSTWNVYAIQMANSFNLNFIASIDNNTFDLFTLGHETVGGVSFGISIPGSIGSDSDINIENNVFNVNLFDITSNKGINVEGGSKYNIKVIGNYFTGGGKHIIFSGSHGGENVISDNTIDPSPSGDFSSGMFIHDFSNTTICGNTNNGASNVGYLFNGQNLGTIFSGNYTYGCWQHTLWIAGDDPVIGQQIHNGNEWGPAVVYNPGGPSGPGFYFVLPFLQHLDPDPDIVGMSKFLVHTPQSVWNGSQYTFFSPFHPATNEIDPDFNNEFFEEQSGTPTVNCITQLQYPDEVDLLIAWVCRKSS